MNQTHDFWVTIHGERGEEWKRVIGTNRLPIKLPTILANLPGIGEARVYLLALEQIQPADLLKIVDHLSNKFGLSAAEAANEIAEAGIPILDRDCSLTILNPMRWMDDDNEG